MGFWPVVKKVVKDSDIILFVLDIRMPGLSRNSRIKDFIRRYRKKIIYVYTKKDLVSKRFLNNVRNRERSRDVFFVSGKKNIGISRLKRELLIVGKSLGVKEPRIGIVGYPNVGKSAIINALAKGSRAKVSRVAGTTKGIQWINAGSLKILDSPGIVPYDDSEIKLAILGAKNPEKLKNPEKAVYKLIENIRSFDEGVFERIYGVDVSSDVDELIEKIGRKRGFLLKGGRIDRERVIMQILRDWQSGKIKI